MKIYNLSDQNLKAFFKTINEYSKNSFDTEKHLLDYIENKTLFVNTIFKYTNLMILIFIVFDVLFLSFLRNLLGVYIGGWSWPVIIILFILSFKFTPTKNKLGELFYFIYPIIGFVQTLKDEEKNDKELLKDIKNYPSIINSTKSKFSVFSGDISKICIDSQLEELPTVIKVLYEIFDPIEAKKLRSRIPEYFYEIGTAAFNNVNRLLETNLQENRNNENPFHRFVEESAKDRTKSKIAIICFEECLYNNLLPQKMDEITEKLNLKYLELYINPALEGVKNHPDLTESLLLNPNILISKSNLAKYLYYSRKIPGHIDKAKFICNDIVKSRKNKIELLRAKYILELLSIN